MSDYPLSTPRPPTRRPRRRGRVRLASAVERLDVTVAAEEIRFEASRR